MSEKERLHTSVLVAPATERRRLRAQRRQAAARLQAEQRRREVAEAKAKAEVERAERKATRYLPDAGEPGKQTLRPPGRFRRLFKPISLTTHLIPAVVEINHAAWRRLLRPLTLHCTRKGSVAKGEGA